MRPLIHTAFYPQTRTAKKVLVVDLGFLGDTIHLVPALWEIKRQYPGCALHVLTSTLGAEVLQLAPCADRAWGVELYRAQTHAAAAVSWSCAPCDESALTWPSTSAGPTAQFS